MGEESRMDWYYDSDSTSSGPAAVQSRSSLEWQNAVDSNGNLFFVKRLARKPVSYPGSKTSSTLTVNYGGSRTASGILGKLIRRRSSRREIAKSDAALHSIPAATDNKDTWDLKKSSYSTEDLSTSSGKPSLTSSLHKEPSTVDCSLQGFAGVLYTTLNQLEESSNVSDIVYSYPPSDNILSSARGLFVTLVHLISTVTGSKPTVSSFLYKGNEINVSYNCEPENLLLLAVPGSRFSKTECLRILDELTSYQQFIFQTAPRCYATPIDNFSNLDTFFEGFFHQLDSRLENPSYEKLQNSFSLAVPFLIVPRDIHLEVEEALNEFESNEMQHGEERRRFSVVGSVYFYKDSAVCSHVCRDDLLEIYLGLRESGILQLMEEGIKDLVYWREVFPISLKRGLATSNPSLPYPMPTGRWFLLVVALGHNAMAALLESGGCTQRITGQQGPDPHYVEEAQATLRHIIKLGTAHFLSKWLGERDVPSEGKLIAGRSTQSLTSFGDAHHLGSVKSYDLADYEAPGEDNMPVLGRRAERQLNEINFQSSLNLNEPDDVDSTKDTKNSDHHSESSDRGKRQPLDGLHISNHRIGGSKYDQYFHYVHLDSSEGIVVSNLFTEPVCPSFARVVDNFKFQVGLVQDVFKSTLLFQDKSGESDSPPLNKSMVAIKECGMLFEIEEEGESEPTTYWVAGRLVAAPCRRELYVCYQDCCSQNLVELAFQLALNASR
ncbi:inturned planar cell polarity effector homolog (Drosophila) [Nesidiocoris tenuis]|uniref:Inturned planar cell polarity effector homolog (Drosophila) n=1 Tax=Nesidiocoris tenuis TaxID=355587 RepID=A0ABN7ASS2_9HEMI|nr:inturned planar cell polarity effector homolog (Drosophila) [Nesidiocoris tenuis]